VTQYSDGGYTTKPATRGHHRRQGVGGLRLRRSTAHARARRPRTHARPTPLLLEERQVDTRPAARIDRRARLLGDKRLPTTTETHGRNSATRATELAARELGRGRRCETPRVKTIVFDVPGWPGHLAGQHVDVPPHRRKTATRPSAATRSPRAPNGSRIELTVERLDNGEVSPYLTDELRPGDRIELRGPVGGYFVWEPANGAPLLLVAGGSGIVPLMAMIRTRAEQPATTRRSGCSSPHEHGTMSSTGTNSSG